MDEKMELLDVAGEIEEVGLTEHLRTLLSLQ